MPEARVIGDVGRPQDGPTLIVTAGLHGNEPEGIVAAERVLARLRTRPPRGRVLALRGNLAALGRGVRHVDRDLNRIWSDDEIARIAAEPHDRSAEERELAALAPAILEAVTTRDPRRRCLLVDLHATSGPGRPFAVSGVLDALIPEGLVPLPVIRGFAARLPGTLHAWFERRSGSPGLVIEGGRIGEETTVAALETALLEVVRTLGLSEPEDASGGPRAAELRARLADVPARLEVAHRHAVGEHDAFRMRPGHENLRRVREGEILADDREGPVRAPFSGFLLFPLYQAQGADGFFVAR